MGIMSTTERAISCIGLVAIMLFTATGAAASPNFTVSASPSSLTIQQGNRGTSTITTTISGGFNNLISLTSTGAPAGSKVTFNPNTISAPGAGSATMTITLAGNTPLGTYPITVMAAGGGLFHTTVVSVTVVLAADFTLSASPASLSVAQGNQGTSTITTSIINGFDSAITLSASLIPTGTTVRFNPDTISAPGAGTSTMTITVGSNTPVGTYPVWVTGNGEGIWHTTIVTLTVTAQGQPNFTVSAAPSSLSIDEGNQGVSTITTVISGGFNNSISLSASGMPAGVGVSFNPSTIPAPGGGTSTMTITVGNTTPTGTYPITVTGSGGGIHRNATVTLTVTAAGQPNFTLSASPASLTIAQGNEGTSTITAAISGGFNSSISLSASGEPTGTTVSFTPETIPAPGAGTSTMTITVGSTTPTGTYPITVTGNGGGTQQTATVTLTVTGITGEPFPAPPKVSIDTTWNPPVGGTTWHVHNSGDLTTALKGFAPGDTIILDASTVYSGNFVIPYKNNPGHLWTYIESSALGSLPAPGTRVSPSDAPNMPKIVTPNATTAIRLCAAVDSYCPSSGTNYIRLVGIEFYSTSNVEPGGCETNQLCNPWSDYLILADSPDDGASPPPADHIFIDRCYIHGSPTQDVIHAVGANASYFAMIESYVSDIHMSNDDSQAVIAYYTPGPMKISNNYLSATTENIMFGGAGGYNNPYVPSDVYITNNYLFKPLSWFSCGDGGTVQLSEYLADGTLCSTLTNHPNQWVVKNNLEFKSAQRVSITGNTLENNWLSGQTGSSILFGVRTGQSGNIAVVDDILFQNNVVTNVTSGISTGSGDNLCGNGGDGYGKCTTPGETKRIWVDNNLFLLRDSQDTYQHYGVVLAAGGVDDESPPKSYPGLTDFIYQHNTVLMSDYSTLFGSAYFLLKATDRCPPSEPSQTHNVWILDNAITRQVTGACGYQGTTGLDYYMSDPSPLAPRFYGNVMFVPSGDGVQSWPGSSNDATTTPFTYVDPGSGDYQLLIPDWTDTTDGKVSGIDWYTLQQGMNP